jgi:hypothetical protein
MKFYHTYSIALKTLFPDQDWSTMQKTSSPGYWEDKNNQVKAIEHIAAKLNVRTLDDWYNIRNVDVIANGGRSVLYQTTLTILW